MLWTLVAAFLSFLSGGVGTIPTAYMATAALILVGSIIENSYFLAYHDELTTLPGRRAYNDALLQSGRALRGCGCGYRSLQEIQRYLWP